MSRPMTQRMPSPDEAPPRFDDSLGYLVRDLYRAIIRMLTQRLADHGVQVASWYFLRVLWEEEGLTQRELAARVNTVEPAAVTALRSLEQAGHIRRERSPTDRRKTYVFLTDRGRALQTTLLPISREVNDAAAAALSQAERQLLEALLRRARSGMPD
jgi:DNA-binding MarR family transcriptional regulator